MGLILWIDQNTFASSLLEKVFIKKNLPFYTISSVDDFSYLVEDLDPEIIVLDGVTFQKNPDAFRKQYEASTKIQKTSFVFLEPRGDLSFIARKIGELNRPFDPFLVPQEIMRMSELN